MFKLMFKKTSLALLVSSLLCASSAISANTNTSSELNMRFAGALEFSDSGTLFVADNHNGAIYAFEIPETALSNMK